jgi:acetyl esterase
MQTFVLSFFTLMNTSGVLFSQSYNVILDQPVNGTFRVDPALPANGKYAAGTLVTVMAIPDPGFVVDAGYFSVPGMWGSMYYESSSSLFKVTIDRDMNIGVSFIDKSEVDHVNVIQIR